MMAKADAEVSFAQWRGRMVAIPIAAELPPFLT
jgi:hypothetical protein